MLHALVNQHFKLVPTCAGYTRKMRELLPWCCLLGPSLSACIHLRWATFHTVLSFLRSPLSTSFAFQLGPPLPHLNVCYLPPSSFMVVVVMEYFERLARVPDEFVGGWEIHLMRYVIICRERSIEFIWLAMGVSWTGDISKSTMGHKLILSSQKTRNIKYRQAFLEAYLPVPVELIYLNF